MELEQTLLKCIQREIEERELKEGFGKTRVNTYTEAWILL